MITVEEYKEHLINLYRSEYDNNPTKREERKRILERKYSDEELIDKAKGYSDYQTLHKENRALYDTIHRRGLEEKAYAHFDTWGRKRWSIESALVAAQECNTA